MIALQKQQHYENDPLPLDYVCQDKKIGALFTQARQALNLTLDDISQHLHIRQVYLQAIEDEQFDEIPGTVYASGFIRLYAKYLKLDGDEIIRQIHFTHQKNVIKHYALHPEQTKEPHKLLVISSFILSLLIAGFLYFFYYNSDTSKVSDETLFHVDDPKDQIQDDVLPVALPMKSEGDVSSPTLVLDKNEKVMDDATTMTQTVPSMPPQDEEKTKENNPQNTVSENQDAKIKIVALNDCWIEVQKNGSVMLSRTLKQGENLTLADVKGLFLTLGNAGGVSLFFNEQLLEKQGELGQVVRQINLEGLVDLKKTS